MFFKFVIKMGFLILSSSLFLNLNATSNLSFFYDYACDSQRCDVLLKILKQQDPGINPKNLKFLPREKRMLEKIYTSLNEKKISFNNHELLSDIVAGSFDKISDEEMILFPINYIIRTNQFNKKFEPIYRELLLFINKLKSLNDKLNEEEKLLDVIKTCSETSNKIKNHYLSFNRYYQSDDKIAELMYCFFNKTICSNGETITVNKAISFIEKKIVNFYPYARIVLAFQNRNQKLDCYKQILRKSYAKTDSNCAVLFLFLLILESWQDFSKNTQDSSSPLTNLNLPSCNNLLFIDPNNPNSTLLSIQKRISKLIDHYVEVVNYNKGSLRVFLYLNFFQNVTIPNMKLQYLDQLTSFVEPTEYPDPSVSDGILSKEAENRLNTLAIYYEKISNRSKDYLSKASLSLKKMIFEKRKVNFEELKVNLVNLVELGDRIELDNKLRLEECSLICNQALESIFSLYNLNPERFKDETYIVATILNHFFARLNQDVSAIYLLILFLKKPEYIFSHKQLIFSLKNVNKNYKLCLKNNLVDELSCAISRRTIFKKLAMQFIEAKDIPTLKSNILFDFISSAKLNPIIES